MADNKEKVHEVQISRAFAAYMLVAMIVVPAVLCIIVYAALTSWGVAGWWRTGLVLIIPAWWAYSGHWMYTATGLPLPWDRRFSEDEEEQ